MKNLKFFQLFQDMKNKNYNNIHPERIVYTYPIVKHLVFSEKVLGKLFYDRLLMDFYIHLRFFASRITTEIIVRSFTARKENINNDAEV